MSQSPAVYSGLSQQRLPLSLTVAPDGETLSLDIAWMGNCGGVVPTVRHAVTRIADDGGFTWVGTHVKETVDGDEERQRLRLVGRREGDGTLTGLWRGETDYYNGQMRAVDLTCSSGDVAVRVSRGGSTRQPPPRRDAAGHLVIGLGSEPDLVAVNGDEAWVLGREIPQGQMTLTPVDQRSGVAGAPIPLGEIGASPAGLAAGEGAAWAGDGVAGGADARRRTHDMSSAVPAGTIRAWRHRSGEAGPPAGVDPQSWAERKRAGAEGAWEAAQAALAKVHELLADGKIGDAQRAALTMAITLDKSAMLEAASQAADEQHARLTSAQGALVAAVLEQFVDSLGLMMTGASRRVLCELLRRASSGEPIDEPPPDADDARREIREQIG